jgi:hypothetical protein
MTAHYTRNFPSSCTMQLARKATADYYWLLSTANIASVVNKVLTHVTKYSRRLSGFKNLECSRQSLAKPAIIKPRENHFSVRRVVPRGKVDGRT